MLTTPADSIVTGTLKVTKKMQRSAAPSTTSLSGAVLGGGCKGMVRWSGAVGSRGCWHNTLLMEIELSDRPHAIAGRERC